MLRSNPYVLLIFGSAATILVAGCGDGEPTTTLGEPNGSSFADIQKDMETDTPTRLDEDTASASDTHTTTNAETDTQTETETARSTDNDAGTDTETGSAVDGGLGLGIRRLAIEDNPNSALSCFATWTTLAPATSVVEFGQGELEFRIRDQALVTEHRVLVIGMRPETEYRVKAVSEAEGATMEAETAYTTGSVPKFLPVPTVGVNEIAPVDLGWTLTNISDGTTEPPPPCVVAMYDAEGYPVWYFVHGDTPDDRGDIDTRLLDDGTVLVGPTAHEPAKKVSLAGEVLWEGPEQVLPNPMSHHFDQLENGNYLTIRDIWIDDFLGNYVEELEPDGTPVWQWSIFDHLVWQEDDSRDWCHGNSVKMMPENDLFYLSCRNMDAILKISLQGTQEVIWRFGKGGDFASDPLAATPWFLKQHAPEIQPSGNILVYDNGGLKASVRGWSRVVEYALNEETLETTIVWEFPGAFEDLDPWYTDEWYTRIWGDADRLPNGNTLVAAGTRTVNQNSRIFEVTEDGRVVWELIFPRMGEKALGLYKAQRIADPPLVELI